MLTLNELEEMKQADEEIEREFAEAPLPPRDNPNYLKEYNKRKCKLWYEKNFMKKRAYRNEYYRKKGK